MKKPKVFVVGNEKGGAGKTTCAMHLIAGLLDRGYKVLSIDADSRQASLTSYVNNRKSQTEVNLLHPIHFHIAESSLKDEESQIEEYESKLSEALSYEGIDYVVIDTPGSCTLLSKICHQAADTILTPLNDSFVDLDVIAKFDPKTLNVIKPSIYSQMVWEQKLMKAKKNSGSIKWMVFRNRLSNTDAINKRRVSQALESLSKRIDFQIISGFSERVAFRELFVRGMTLLDASKENKILNSSSLLAKQEVRSFLNYLL
ncbi:ATPase domain protein [Rickettsiales endosymbiont of Paramecium tredecaurelia]|uniref:division plane positioning ATPase MipZ n=1 Tax=Candidatus Sarmatiella mevalonica TaxID=2770581 RepID=UPI001920E0CB|nr:division plane positioning ATPase MipZ [Candidatus Sarmatiella mevalonica]MBL3284240.1 ATPase domain protein [Candidatus Sarmatiella mevalonica]